MPLCTLQSGCIVLAGENKNIGFYEKCGYICKEVSMAKYLDRQTRSSLLPTAWASVIVGARYEVAASIYIYICGVRTACTLHSQRRRINMHDQVEFALEL